MFERYFLWTQNSKLVFLFRTLKMCLTVSDLNCFQRKVCYILLFVPLYMLCLFSLIASYILLSTTGFKHFDQDMLCTFFRISYARGFVDLLGLWVGSFFKINFKVFFLIQLFLQYFPVHPFFVFCDPITHILGHLELYHRWWDSSFFLFSFYLLGFHLAFILCFSCCGIKFTHVLFCSH